MFFVLFIIINIIMVVVMAMMMMVAMMMVMMTMVMVMVTMMMVMVTMVMVHIFKEIIQMLMDLLDLLHQGFLQTFGVQGFQELSSILLKFLNLATDFLCQLLAVVTYIRLKVC